MQVVDLVVPENVQLDPGPVSRVDFAARITKIQCDLEKATVILKADTALHADRLAALNHLASHRSGRNPAHHAIGNERPAISSHGHR